jgi:hypothetical protein
VSVVSVSLDHISIAAPFAELERRGFRVETTPGSEGQHARVFLRGAYLEITAPLGEHTRLVARGWFIRVDDLTQAAAHLREQQLPASDPVPYHGLDGTWLDVELTSAASAGLPRLTHRLDPPPSGWPPPPTETHPNGVHSITELELSVAQPHVIRQVLGSLGASAKAEERCLLGKGTAIVVKHAPDAREGITSITFAGAPNPDLKITLGP